MKRVLLATVAVLPLLLATSPAWAGPVVGVAAALAGSAVASAFTVPLVGSLAGFAVSSAINAVGGSLFAKKPKAPGFQEQARGLNQLVRSSVESHKIIYGRMRTSGTLLYIATSDDPGRTDSVRDNRFLHMVIALAGHEVDDVEAIYFNDQRLDMSGAVVASAPYSNDDGNWAWVFPFRGTDDQLVDASFLQIPGWTTDHRLRGIAGMYVRLAYNADVFPNGIPTPVAVVRGKKVYDPRDANQAPTSRNTWRWSDNAALCIRDYLASRDAANYPYGFGCSPSEIDDSYTIAAANTSDETIAKANGSVIRRYTCNGIVDTATAPLDNLEQMVSALAGAVTCPRGVFRIHAGAYDTPEATVIDESMLAGEVEVRPRAPGKEIFNSIRGTYVDPNRNWQPTDFPQITSAVYLAQDNGEPADGDIDLPYTTDPDAAQRIAQLMLRRQREQVRLTLPLNYKGLRYAVWDTAKVSLAQFGFVEKVFRIESWVFDLTGGVTLQLREENPLAYDWSASDAQVVAAAPDTNLPTATFIAAPGVPSVDEVKYSTRMGAGVKVKAVVSWGASTDAFLQRYRAEYKPIASTAWVEIPLSDGTSAEVIDIAPGRYDFRVKAINQLGVSSAWAYRMNKEIVGLGDVPADITGLTIQALSSIALVQWTLPPDLDVTEGGRILARHSEAVFGATWENSYSLGEPIPGNQPFALLPLKEGTYLFKAEDSSGVKSRNAATVSTKNASLLTFSTVDSVQEDPLFNGTHANTVATDGVLKLAGAQLFDDIPDVDAMTTFDASGGVMQEGTYVFAAGIDLGSVQKVRLETSLDVLTVNTADMIDARAGLIDDWVDFDGTAGGGSVDAWIEVRETDDDPAGDTLFDNIPDFDAITTLDGVTTGATNWSEWQRITAGDYEARAFQARCQVRSFDPAYNAHVSKLRLTAKEIA